MKHCNIIARGLLFFSAAACALAARAAETPATLHYRPKVGVFADPIPMFHKGDYHVFYLRGSIGPVPWEHIVSRDLVHWKSLPTALRPDGERNGPDGENMFTGSAVEGLGQFHIFYTGDNGRNRQGSEFIMHAVSPDLVHWTKHPQDMLAPDGILYKNSPQRDFRDPYVFWNDVEKRFWMVFFANDAKTGAGVQGLAVSDDLTHWRFQPPLAGAAGQECPDLFQIGDTWYLIGGDGYSFAKQPRGPYKAPPVCRQLDRPQVYAAKRMFDGKRHIWTGWIWDTSNGRDGGPGIWGGSQCLPREIYAGPAGQLYCRPIEEAIALFTKIVPGSIPTPMTYGARCGKLASEFSGVEFAVPDSYLLDCKVHLDPRAELTIAFRKQPDANDSGYRLLLRPAAGKAELSGPGFHYTRPCAFDLRQPVKIQAFVQGTIIECFINDQFACTCRAYDFSKGRLGVGVQGGSATVIDLAVKVPGQALDERANVNRSALDDKTLAVWAAPANLTQRGGTALTIDDCAGGFDGIVFGELAQGKWMAGSNGFSRTQMNQAASPRETTNYTCWTAIAITYKGRDVTIYWNGQKYAHYTMASPPHGLPPESVAVIGMRHLLQGDDAHFAGTIEDARIYDRALSQAEILKLCCKKQSDPKPWAWWTFDDRNFKDRMGRFKAVKLVGGAAGGVGPPAPGRQDGGDDRRPRPGATRRFAAGRGSAAAGRRAGRPAAPRTHARRPLPARVSLCHPRRSGHAFRPQRGHILERPLSPVLHLPRARDSLFRARFEPRFGLLAASSAGAVSHPRQP